VSRQNQPCGCPVPPLDEVYALVDPARELLLDVASDGRLLGGYPHASELIEGTVCRAARLDELLGAPAKRLLRDLRSAREPMNTDVELTHHRRAFVRVIPRAKSFRLYFRLRVTQARELDRLTTEESTFWQLFEGAPIPMIVGIGMDGLEAEAMRFNRRWVEVFGYTAEDLPDIEHWWLQAYPDESYRVPIRREWVRRLVESIGSMKPIAPLETIVTCKDGTRRTVDFAASVVGKYHVVYAFDLTAQKQAEETLRQEAQLRERLMAIVGHDLRSPLTIVGLAAERLRLEADAKHAEEVRRIVKSSARMRRMIDDLLDFTRAHQGGGIPISRSECDLGSVCRQIADETDTSAGAGTVQLTANGDTRGSWDPDRILQAVQNLVGNAVTYREPHTPIELDVDGSGDRVLLRIVNRSPPIPPELLQHIFEPFKRAAQDGGRSGSLGLGLYIVQTIVLAHGGTITCTSDAATGTAFTVQLPRGR
jgi:signal transduction histidine kinase